MLVQLCRAHLGSLHRRERALLKKARTGDFIDSSKILRSADRKRKQAREVIFLA